MPTTKQKIIAALLKSRLGAVWIEKLGTSIQKSLTFTEAELALRLSPQLEVLDGPFRGLKYPKFGQFSLSKVLPKLLGSYECELHPSLQALSERKYASIINIGCAEGYYAAGLARQFPEATVYAFDLNPLSLECAAEMAALNGVADRVVFGGLFSSATCRSQNWRQPVLVVSDCEGAEYDLITPENFGSVSFDALIEIHNCRAGEGQALAMVQPFAQTHEITWIAELPRHASDYPRLAPFSPGEKFRLMDEGRSYEMGWVLLTAKA